MQSANRASGERGNPSPPIQSMPELLGVKSVAALLSYSVRHVYRSADAGRMPRPVKPGHLVRWRRRELA